MVSVIPRRRSQGVPLPSTCPRAAGILLCMRRCEIEARPGRCSGGSALWRRRDRAERGTVASAMCGGAYRRPGPISHGEGEGEGDGEGATSARAERGERDRDLGLREEKVRLRGEGSRPGPSHVLGAKERAGKGSHRRGRRTIKQMSHQKKCPRFVLFSCRRYYGQRQLVCYMQS
jgi:hypothetical protein